MSEALGILFCRGRLRWTDWTWSGFFGDGVEGEVRCHSVSAGFVWQEWACLRYGGESESSETFTRLGWFLLWILRSDTPGNTQNRDGIDRENRFGLFCFDSRHTRMFLTFHGARGSLVIVLDIEGLGFLARSCGCVL